MKTKDIYSTTQRSVNMKSTNGLNVSVMLLAMMLGYGSLAFAAATSAETGSNTATITLGSTTTISGKGAQMSGSAILITSGGDYTVTGTMANGTIRVNTKETVQIRLNNASIRNGTGPAIEVVSAKKFYLYLVESTTNTLEDGASYSVDAKGTIFSNDSVEIDGKGSLKIVGNYKHGIASDDTIVVKNGVITVSSKTDGLHANDSITVAGGTLKITSGSDGFESEGIILVSGGSISVKADDDGMHSEGDFRITGGTIDITGSYEGLEGKTTMTVDGGTIRVVASDDGINVGSNLIVNNGYLYVLSGGDGFDSNGNMTINNGTMVVYSGNNANGPLDIDDRQGIFTINGGTILASGGMMGIAVGASSKQYSLWVATQVSARQVVNVSASDGTSLISFAPPQSASLFFYSSPALKSGGIYTISSGGSAAGTVKDGVYPGTYAAGTKIGTVTMSAKSMSLGQGQAIGGREGKPGRP